MGNVDKSLIARIKKNGQLFEIFVDPDMALAFKEGKKVEISDILAVDKIFAHAGKGQVISPKLLEQAFGTDDVEEVAKIILTKGDVPVSSEHKNKEQEQKLKKIVYLIHRNAVNPQTDKPISPETIENAIKQAKVHLDASKSAEEEMHEVIKKITPMVALKMEIKELLVKIPGKHSENAFKVLKVFGKVMKEKWGKDNDLEFIIAMPGGMEEEFYEKLNSLTHGYNHVEIISKR